MENVELDMEIADDVYVITDTSDSNNAAISATKEKVRAKQKHFGGDFCCVPMCSNRRQKDKYHGIVCTYYQLPSDDRRRAKWLRLIRRGGGWQPKPCTKICSDHFVGGKKSDDPFSESFTPTIFPYNKQSAPRPSRTATAAGYTPTPKTWLHMKPRQNQKQSEPVASVTPPTYSVHEELQRCGHDYIKTTLDTTQYDVETLAALSELGDLKLQGEILSTRLLTIDNLKDDNNMFRFFTNLPNYAVFTTLRDYLQKRAGTDGSHLIRWKGGKTSTQARAKSADTCKTKPGPRRKLTFENEFFLVLVKLKTGRLNRELAFHFNISEGLVSEIFSTWINFLVTELKLLFEMPSIEECSSKLPDIFKRHPSLLAVIDCTELMLQKASDLNQRKVTFSNYKHHDTVKFLVSMSPNLYVNFVSDAWGGRASDKHITLNSQSFLHGLLPGKTVMADRGFTVSSELQQMGVHLLIPNFKGRERPQMTATECSSSEKIARSRIHIERAIQRIRTFHILGTVVRLDQIDIIEQIFTVCAYLTNFQLPIIR